MCLCAVVIVNCKLEPVVRLFCKGSSDWGIACVLDHLAGLKELIPCGVCGRNLSTGSFHNCFVYIKAFPVAIEWNCVLYAVCRGCRNHVIFHIGSIFRILSADVLDGNNLASFYKRIAGYVQLHMEILPCSFHRLKTVVNIHPAHQNSPCGKAAVHHVADNVKAVVCFQKSHSRIQAFGQL